MRAKYHLHCHAECAGRVQCVYFFLGEPRVCVHIIVSAAVWHVYPGHRPQTIVKPGSAFGLYSGAGAGRHANLRNELPSVAVSQKRSATRACAGYTTLRPFAAHRFRTRSSRTKSIVQIAGSRQLTDAQKAYRFLHSYKSVV